MVFTLIEQTINPGAKISDADMAIRAALSMLGIKDEIAKKLTESKLVIASLSK